MIEAAAFDALAQRLADTLPPDDRADGYRLLSQQILPSTTDGAPSSGDARAALDVVSDELEHALTAVPVDDRLAALEGFAFESEFEAETRYALDLAVARYGQRHPVNGEAATWLTPRVLLWTARPVEQLIREAEVHREILGRWKERAAAVYPHVWEARRSRWLIATHWLGAASTGSFETSSGLLNDFVRAAGGETTELEIF